MSQINHQDTGLTYQILTSKRPGLSRGLPPGKEDLAWVANSATLISGQRDAVLVDTFLTSEQAKTLAAWVAASGKNLTAIYVTHGHGDHFFGLVHQVSDWCSGVAIKMGRRQGGPSRTGPKKEHIWIDR
jgi:glyoxylase-like metal-dependent hydrolase (beta-lactamase superfamily II)